VYVGFLFESFDRDAHLHRRLPDQRRQLTCAVAERRDAIPADDGGRRVDRVHHVVERRRQLVDVFAIDWCNERAVQALDDLVSKRVALLLDLLYLQRGVPRRRVGRQHPFQQGGAGDDAVSKGDEIFEEFLFFRDEAESPHVTSV
jgi:hypothetical protein